MTQHRLSTAYRVFAVGFVLFSGLAALAFSGLFTFVLLSGQSISVMSDPELFPKADAYFVSDLFALAGIVCALVAGITAMIMDTREGKRLDPYKGHTPPSGLTINWIMHLRPAMKIWFVGFALAVVL